MSLRLFDNILRPNKPKATITGGDLKSTSISEARKGIVSFPSLPAISAPCLNCLFNSIPMANQRVLRGITVASFLPAFALCIAAGAITNNPLPAVGIVPQFFSSVLGIAILAGPRKQQPKWRQPNQSRSSRTDDDEAQIGPDSLSDTGHEPQPQNSFLVFLADVILAASLFAVLVPTWIKTNGTWGYYWADRVMLATYATVPLIVNATIHILLALQGFIAGTGLGRIDRSVRRTFQRLCSFPEECPRCGNHLLASDSDEAEAPSWFRDLTGDGGQIKLPVSAVPGASTAVGWKAPPWLGQKGLAKVVEEDEGRGAGESYRDDGGVDEEGAAGVGGKGKAVSVDGEGF